MIVLSYIRATLESESSSYYRWMSRVVKVNAVVPTMREFNASLSALLSEA